ncbi:MAG: hypothetical protein VB084_12850 [Syntrophomonadaceae bacterium]|nr:hypothetical protein [Syntrophomonadaceae bacterium]
MLDKGKLLLALLLLLSVSGCANPSWTMAGKIVPPVYDVCPLEGKWTVVQDLGSEGYSAETDLEAEGSSIQFSREIAVLGSNAWNQPTYKIKKVSSTDYLMTRYIVLDGYLASISQEVEVVTVFADSNYLGEFMKLDDATVIAFVQNRVLLLHKIADHADDPLTVANAKIADGSQYDNAGPSGIFLGLKIPSNNDYIYKTVWIAADAKKLRPVLSRDDIYFPRKSGFWELQVKSGLKQGETAELWAHNVAVKDSAAAEEQASAPTASPATQSVVIDYIGNDYVTITNKIGAAGKLQVLPVDKLSAPIGIKVSDLLGAAGLTAYYSAREQAQQTLQSQGVTWIDDDVNEDNFGLTRKNGHWHLQGRINYQRDDTPGTMEFNINFLPPANLIFYDTLYLSWQSVKDRVPNALDAFTSPAKDIAVIKTKNKLYFFGISGEQLDSIPLGEMELKKGTSVIMAEWATGFYVDDWEKTFRANGAHVVENSSL